MSRILVVGATGQVGSRIATQLARSGHSVVGLSRERRAAPSFLDPHGGRAGQSPGLGALNSRPDAGRPGDAITWKQADVVAGTGVAAAMQGVESAFFMSPPGIADQRRILVPLIDAARGAGVHKVVLLSAFGANANEAAPLRQAELHLERSGLAFNILRPNWFMQNFHTFWVHGIKAAGKILLPAGRAKVSFIDAGDIADAASALLVDDRQDGKAFDLTGGAALDHDEVALILSRVAGRSIAYEEITPEAFRAGLVGAGLPADYADFLVMIMGFLAQGYNAAVTPDLAGLIGRAPTEFATYAERHAAAWRV